MKGLLGLALLSCGARPPGAGGAALRHAGQLAASPVSAHEVPAAFPSHSLGVVTTRNVSRHCKPSPGRRKHARLRTSALRTQKDHFAPYLLGRDSSQLCLILEELAALPVRPVGGPASPGSKGRTGDTGRFGMFQQNCTVSKTRGWKSRES